jgi:hypothetical protein
MGCHPVAVVTMRVHKYELRSYEIKSGGLHEKHTAGSLNLGNHFSIRL